MPFARESRDQERATRQKLDLVRQLADDNRGRNELMERINRVVYMQDQVKIPARWQNFALEVKAPLALRTVNTITAALSVNAPAVHFEPIKLGSAGDQNATLREHFFEASWLRQEEEADRQLFRVWMHNLVTHGMGILKTVECANTQWAQYYTESRKLSQAMTSYGPADRHRFDVATEELKLKASYPIMTTVVPPSNFYALQTERGFSVCAEVSDVPYYEALTAYGAGLNRAGKIVPEAQGLPLDEWPRVMSSRRTLRKLEVWEWDYCFPAGTMVDVDSAPESISRRWYEGHLVEITTASGYKLAGTPNHPILTDRGWVGLGKLTKGDRVISRRLGNGRPLARPYAQHGQTEISQLFNLATKANPPERHVDAPENFHGDGQHGYVDVVAINGELQYRLKTARLEPSRQLALVGSAMAEGSLSGNGSLMQSVGVGRAPTSLRALLGSPRPAGLDRQGRDRLQSFSGDLLPSLNGSPRGADSVGTLVIPNLDTRLTEYADNASDRATKEPCDSGKTLTEFDVVTDEIVRVARIPFSGHVYNLGTESHYYSANQIIAHNCYHFLSDPGSGGSSNNFNTARLVRVVKHRYGNPLTHTLRGPYFMAGGVSTSSTDNRYSNLSTIFGFLYLYPLYDAMLTGMAEGGFQWAYPFLGQDANAAPRLPELPQVGLSPLVDQHGTQLRSTIQLQPGDVLPPGYHFVEPPRLGMDMKEFMATTRNLLEMALPDVMQGIGTSGDSGYAINLAAQRARAEWDPIVKQAQRALSRRTAFESWLIEVCVGERVYAWGDLPSDGPLAKSREGYLSIHPDDLAGVHRYSVRLEPETPANRVIDVRTHAEMVDKRFETWEQAVEELGNSPSEVELGWLLYDLKQDPDIKQLVLNKAKELVAVSLQSQQAQARADILDALGLGGGGQLAEGQGAGAQAMADAAQAGGPPSGSPAGAQPPGTGLGRYGQVRTPGMGMPIQPPPETIPAHGLPGGGGP